MSLRRDNEELSILYTAERAVDELKKANRLTMKMTGLTFRAAGAVVEKIRDKKMLAEIEEGNKARRNVHNAGHATPDSLSLDPLGNVLITGSVQSLERPILSTILANHAKGCPIVILHRGNAEIESIVHANGGRVINSANCIYDPFFNRSSYDIYKMLQTICMSTLTGMSLKPEALQYVTAMHLYIAEVKKRKLYLSTAAKCPHNDLLTKMNQAFSSGIISQASYDRMSQAYMAGQNERFALMNVIEELNRNGQSICHNGLEKKHPFNIRTAIGNPGIVAISVTTPVVLDMIASEIEQEIINGQQMIVCFDQLYINKNKTVQNMLTQRSLNTVGGGSIIIAEDMLNMCSGDEKMFADIYATMDTVLLARHPQGKTVEQWSVMVGEYEKIERSWGTDKGKMRQKPWEIFAGSHSGQNQTFTNKRERILKHEDITSLREREFYYISKSGQRILKTSI